MFYYYGSSVIFHNSANDNICSVEDMSADKIEPIIYNGVETIGGKYLIPKGIVTVIWSWTDDEGQLHTNKLDNVLYFPDSSVNILSENSLAESMKDDDVTWLLPKRKYYIYNWGFGEYENTIPHPENYLP